MAKPRDERQKDLLKPSLDQIIDLSHLLVRLAGTIDWEFLGQRFSAVCTPGPGQPGLPTRLVAGLFILKHQFFCGGLSFCHRPLYARIGASGWARSRWRRSPGEPIGGA